MDNNDKYIKEKSRLVSIVKNDKTLFNLAKEINRYYSIQEDINKLLKQLIKGNHNPGMGTKHLFKSIYCLRGRNGGRVFYSKYNGICKIVAYAIGIGKHRNEKRVIDRLKEIYDVKEI